MFSYDDNSRHVDMLNENKKNQIVEIARLNNHYFIHDENICDVLWIMRDESNHVEITIEELSQLDIWQGDWNNYIELKHWLTP